MGQYYRVCMGNLLGEKRRVYDPIVVVNGEKENMGYKLLENCNIGNMFTNGITQFLLASPGRAAWVGDYSNDPIKYDEKRGVHLLVSETHGDISVAVPTYEEVWPNTKQGDLVAKPLVHVKWVDYTGLKFINCDKRVFVDMEKYIKANTFLRGRSDGREHKVCISPLPILTALGNGGCCGDYMGINYEQAGSWAWDLICFSKTVPMDYEETELHFRDR